MVSLLLFFGNMQDVLIKELLADNDATIPMLYGNATSTPMRRTSSASDVNLSPIENLIDITGFTSTSPEQK